LLTPATKPGVRVGRVLFFGGRGSHRKRTREEIIEIIEPKPNFSFPQTTVCSSEFRLKAPKEAESLEFRLQFDRVQRVLVITMGTVITEDSVIAVRTAVHSFLEVEDPLSVVADLSLVERIKVSTDFVWSITAKPPELAVGRPCILVAPKEATYGMSRMFQILRNVPSLEVVHSMKDALALLGLKAFRFERGAST